MAGRVRKPGLDDLSNAKSDLEKDPVRKTYIETAKIRRSACSPNSCVEVLTPNAMLFGGGAFGR